MLNITNEANWHDFVAVYSTEDRNINEFTLNISDCR